MLDALTTAAFLLVLCLALALAGSGASSSRLETFEQDRLVDEAVKDLRDAAACGGGAAAGGESASSAAEGFVAGAVNNKRSWHDKRRVYRSSSQGAKKRTGQSGTVWREQGKVIEKVLDKSMGKVIEKVRDMSSRKGSPPNAKGPLGSKSKTAASKKRDRGVSAKQSTPKWNQARAAFLKNAKNIQDLKEMCRPRNRTPFKGRNSACYLLLAKQSGAKGDTSVTYTKAKKVFQKCLVTNSTDHCKKAVIEGKTADDLIRDSGGSVPHTAPRPHSEPVRN